MTQWSAQQSVYHKAHIVGAGFLSVLVLLCVPALAFADTSEHLAAPTNGAPQGMVIASRTIVFQWEPATETASRYELIAAHSPQTDDAGRLSDPFILNLTDLAEPQAAADLPSDGDFYWQVRAINSDGTNTSPWSQVWYLSIDTTPPNLTIGEFANDPELPVIEGTIDDPGAVISVDINGVSQGNPTINPSVIDGRYNWSLLLQKALSYDTYTIMVSTSDMYGNTSHSSKIIIISPPVIADVADVPNYTLTTLSVSGLAVPIKELPRATTSKISSALDLQPVLESKHLSGEVQSAATIHGTSDLVAATTKQKSNPLYIALVIAAVIFVLSSLAIIYKLGKA